MITSSLEVFIWPVQHVKRLSFICGLDHLPILKNVGEDLDTNYVISVNPISGRWQAPAAVLPPEGWQRGRGPEGPEDKGHGHSRARRAREWPKHASPRARGPEGPRTSKAKCPSRCLPVLLYVFHNSAQNREIQGPFSRR